MSKVLNKYQDKRTPGSIYVGRGSPWGNPFAIGKDGDRDEVIAKFCTEILPTLDIRPLKGHDLVCCCAPKNCHADALLEKANFTFRKSE